MIVPLAALLNESEHSDQKRRWVGFMSGLVCELRARYGARLRAGQPLNSLGLSRSREHGLRSEQSHLWVHPRLDGSSTVEGRIGDKPVRLGPTAPELGDALRSALDELCSIPID